MQSDNAPEYLEARRFKNLPWSNENDRRQFSNPEKEMNSRKPPREEFVVSSTAEDRWIIQSKVDEVDTEEDPSRKRTIILCLRKVKQTDLQPTKPISDAQISTVAKYNQVSINEPSTDVMTLKETWEICKNLHQLSRKEYKSIYELIIELEPDNPNLKYTNFDLYLESLQISTLRAIQRKINQLKCHKTSTEEEEKENRTN